MHLRQVEGVSFVYRRYTKRVPFLSKIVCKRIRGWGGGKIGGPSSYNTLLSAPPAHWAIITSRSEKLCVLICCFSLPHFILHSIGMLLFSLHPSPLSATFHHFSRDTSHVSVRPIKTFLHDKPKRKFFPWTRLWEGICPIFWRICKLLAVFISLAIMGWLNLLTKCLIM